MCILLNDFFLTVQMSGSTNTSKKPDVLLVVYVAGNRRQTPQNTEIQQMIFERTILGDDIFLKYY